MSYADLHLHSKYSDHPSEWFLRKLGTSESYTEPEFIYRTAKARGMDFVTITDHNNFTGSKLLHEAHPEDTFTGVESTVYFPEDGCKVHILVWNLTEEQFEQIQRLRRDIYAFRDFLKWENLPYAVAHATYSLNRTILPDHLEKLILLFDVFEAVNGGRNARNNRSWEEFLRTLTREDTDRLYKKHTIEPFGDTPWIKGFTGGSDDHAGIYLAKSFTTAEGDTPAAFLDSIRSKQSEGRGRHADFHGFALSVYKIAYDHLRSRQNTGIDGPLSLLTKLIFDRDNFGVADRLKVNYFRRKKKKNKLNRLIGELIDELKSVDLNDPESQMDIVYTKVTQISDKLLKDTFKTITENVQKGRFDPILTSLSSFLPGIFLYVPFITSFTHMFNNRDLVPKLAEGMGRGVSQETPRILWFSDTLTEMNGVADTVKEMGRLAYQGGKPISLVGAIAPEEMPSDLPPNFINIPLVFDEPLPLYEKLRVKIPSILEALKLVYEYDPDEIFISTPLVLGLTGLAVGKLLGVPCTGIFHTDGTEQVRRIAEDITITKTVEDYMKWFYSMCDRTLVNTREYEEILIRRGFNTKKIELFPRGIDTELFNRFPVGRQVLAKMWKIPEKGQLLLFAGRISKDKDIELVIRCFEKLSKRHADIHLAIAGEGPDLKEMKKRYGDHERIFFLGRVDHDTMPLVYSAADLFVFPSRTDTFGRVVLEALACGVPVIVSNEGGPQELVNDSDAGIVIDSVDLDTLSNAVERRILTLKNDPVSYSRLRDAARTIAVERYDLKTVIRRLFHEQQEEQTADVHEVPHHESDTGSEPASDPETAESADEGEPVIPRISAYR
jgi:glycosyltransferase involved in cell wall biosynthesis